MKHENSESTAVTASTLEVTEFLLDDHEQRGEPQTVTNSLTCGVVLVRRASQPSTADDDFKAFV